MPKKNVSEDVAPFVSIKKSTAAVKALKTYLEALSKPEDDGKKAKKKLPLGDDVADGLQPVYLQVDFKKIPTNATTFVNRFGPLPCPWIVDHSDAEICFFVRDPEPKKPLTDRELDLQNTRDHYMNILRETGLSDDFLTNRLTIMPMRELLTEYKSHDAKRRLVNGFDVFLADKTLMNNKFKELNQFLGVKVWQQKKVPVPIDLKKRGTELGAEIISTLEKTDFHVSGRGSSQSVVIGLLKQGAIDLGKNLNYILVELKKLYNRNVATLRIKTETSMAIPFYCDLESANELDPNELAPKSATLQESNPDVEVIDLFSLCV